MTYQIVNVENPNSVENTVVFAIYEGDDNFKCLSEVLALFANDISMIVEDMMPGSYKYI